MKKLKDLRRKLSSKFSTPVKVGDILPSLTTDYLVLKTIGEGVYGEVLECLDIKNQKIVAVKILKYPNARQNAKHEMSFLKIISPLNHKNLVKFFERFKYKRQECLVFEMLYRNLQYFIIVNPDRIPLNKIRAIAKQLFMAMEALSTVGIIHTDIKPDNIMFKSCFDMRIKLIDFGVAIRDADVLVGDKVQPIGFRAPEILLGLPYTNAIDMWGVGCVLANLYLRFFLFNADTDYEMMRQVVQLLGQPEDGLLHAGIYTKKYFIKVKRTNGSTWRLKDQSSLSSLSEKTAEVYNESNKNTRQNFKDCIFPCLDELVYVSILQFAK
ncbi:unnamed protein product [Tetraodon nigroviridis]|uniref:(spotted green pufferfish) hypothetical protein n=1 Tax=Tetraodon nigroviridis TaxID=99883 RepID=Q4RWZ5_TETNG|nr:unnamed protein product [Tetraodon nigroviridis]